MTSVEIELPEEFFERVGWRRYGKPWGRWKYEAQVAAVTPQGRKHPGVPDDNPRNFPKPSRASSPHSGGKDFLPGQAYNCQAVVDSAHQVIVAARATTPPGKQQVSGDDGGDHRQRRCSSQGIPPMLVFTGTSKTLDGALCVLGVHPVRRARSRARPRPGLYHSAPRVAYPDICLPDRMSTQVQPGGVGSAARLCGCKL